MIAYEHDGVLGTALGGRKTNLGRRLVIWV